MSAPTSTVFGRSVTSHPYEPALKDWQHSRDGAKMSLACNLRHDQRVTPAREQHFDDVCGQPRTASELEHAINYYFEEKVRTRDLPDFVYHEINANNLISGHAKLSGSLLNKEQKLVRILDLNGLRRAFRGLSDVSHRKPEWEESFKDYYSIPRDLITNDFKEQRWIDRWLDKMLDPRNMGRRENFVAAVLDMLNSIRRAKAFQPVWATTWSAFEPYARTFGGHPNPDRWVQIMGMGLNPPRHWYVVLTYTVAEAGTLARPTQLDAGWYQYHFPSPEESPLEMGGHPMELSAPSVAITLLPEYIHKQIEHPLKHWDDTGRLLGRTSDWQLTSLLDMRRAHHRLLVSTYGTTAYSHCPHGKICNL